MSSSKPWRDYFTPDPIGVRPRLTTNLFLDHTLKLKRGPDGTELVPKDCMGSGDGYLHFTIPVTVAEEAAWWALGHDHAVPCSMSINLLRAAEVRKGPLIGTGEIIRIGKQIMVAEGICSQDSHLIAKVIVTFTLFMKRNPKDAVCEKCGQAFCVCPNGAAK